MKNTIEISGQEIIVLSDLLSITIESLTDRISDLEIYINSNKKDIQEIIEERDSDKRELIILKNIYSKLNNS